MQSLRRINGFTLVELLVTLAVAAVVLALVMPTVSQFGARLRARSVAATVVTSLAYARIAAVSRNEAVTLCPSADGNRCTGAEDWSGGWIIYSDANRDVQPKEPSLILQRFEGLPPTARLTATAGRPRIRFQPEGWASGSNVTLQLCTARNAGAKIILSNAGRARVELVEASACGRS